MGTWGYRWNILKRGRRPKITEEAKKTTTMAGLRATQFGLHQSNNSENVVANAKNALMGKAGMASRSNRVAMGEISNVGGGNRMGLRAKDANVPAHKPARGMAKQLEYFSQY